MSAPYLTIAHGGETETEARRSRFLCAVARTETEEEARAFIAQRRALHKTATHNCTAYVVGEGGQRQKTNDDGEPSGTAGMPMLEVLRHRGLTDVTAVVTRYFGGVKLGGGGLIRAYGTAVGAALDDVGLVRRNPVLVMTVTVDHQRAGRLENDLRGLSYEVRDVDYGADVRLQVCVPEPEADSFGGRLADLTEGQATAEPTGRTFTETAWSS